MICIFSCVGIKAAGVGARGFISTGPCRREREASGFELGTICLRTRLSAPMRSDCTDAFECSDWFAPMRSDWFAPMLSSVLIGLHRCALIGLHRCFRVF